MTINVGQSILWEYKEQFSQGGECHVFNGSSLIAKMFIPNLKVGEGKTQSYIAVKFNEEDWEIMNGNKNILELLFKTHIINMTKIGSDKPFLVYKTKPLNGKAQLVNMKGSQLILNLDSNELLDSKGEIIAKFNISKLGGSIEIIKNQTDLIYFLLFVVYLRFKEWHIKEISRFS